MEDELQPFLTLDSRRRASLGKYARDEDSMYLVDVDDRGIITLIPAVAVPIAKVNLPQEPA